MLYLQINKFHTIDGDDLFFCGDEIKRSLLALTDKFDIVQPTHSSSKGGGTVGYSIRTKCLNNIVSNTTSVTNTEMIMAFLNKEEELRKTVLEEPSSYRIEGRITLDYWEDYIFLECQEYFLETMLQDKKYIIS